MPSVTPSYIYTFAALIAVSTLLVSSFMAYADTLRASAETKQLKNLMDSIAAKSIELVTLSLTTNATVKSYLQMPNAIGSKQYWLRLGNDSASAWVEGGFGNLPVQKTELRVYLPKEAVATGCYIGGYGMACLECYFNADIGAPQIQLKSLG